jgi:hypothetical protein
MSTNQQGGKAVLLAARLFIVFRCPKLKQSIKHILIGIRLITAP